MKYDFTSIMDRRGMDASAVDCVPTPKEGFDIIPMGVADMNFPTCPAIPEAIIKRAQHPAYGYFPVREEFYDTIIRWQTERLGQVGLKKEHIGYENGVLGGVLATVYAYTTPGDKILIHYPAYPGFTINLQNAGYHCVRSDLKRDENGVWRMDFEDMDRKLEENNIHIAIMCSPHNPCGRVWERWELEKAMEIFQKHDCVVICDEIWADMALEGRKHIPLQTISEDARNRVVAIYSPSKTFNMGGMFGSYDIIYNKSLRDRVRVAANRSHYNAMNVLAMHAHIAAYSDEGMEWADELVQVLAGNVNYACDFIWKNFPDVQVSKPEGTYMLFLDCEQWCRKKGIAMEDLVKAGHDVGVIWQAGTSFGYPWCVRMNLALPLSRVEEAFRRLKKYVFV